MHRKLRFLVTAIVAGLLIGCASVGNNFDQGKISQIKKGETTEADLIQMFGEPQQRGGNSEGQTTMTWVYSEATVKGESFIPYAGAFMGGTRSREKSLTVTLQDGKVRSYSSTGGAIESRGTTQGVPKK